MPDPRPAPPAASRGPGVIAAFLGLVVAFNTLVYSCSNDRLARENAQLQRSATEERFWTEAMRDLGALVAEKGKADVDAANWESRCKLLALRTGPFSFDTSSRTQTDQGDEAMSARAKAEQLRIQQLKLAFVQRIQDPEFVTEGCRQTFANQQFDSAQEDAGAPAVAVAAATTQPDQSGTPASPEQTYEATSVTASAIAQRSNIIALTPASPTGWDVDLFWCERRGETATASNYRDALAIAQLLAAKAQNGERVGGQMLGRIRARTLPISQQSSGRFPVRGATIRADGGRGEFELANALREALPQYKLSVPQPGGRVTRWYLSMFLCGAADGARRSG